MEPFVCGGDVALCQITLTACYLWPRTLTPSHSSSALRAKYCIVGFSHNTAI